MLVKFMKFFENRNYYYFFVVVSLTLHTILLCFVLVSFPVCLLMLLMLLLHERSKRTKQMKISLTFLFTSCFVPIFHDAAAAADSGCCCIMLNDVVDVVVVVNSKMQTMVGCARGAKLQMYRCVSGGRRRAL